MPRQHGYAALRMISGGGNAGAARTVSSASTWLEVQPTSIKKTAVKAAIIRAFILLAVQDRAAVSTPSLP